MENKRQSVTTDKVLRVKNILKDPRYYGLTQDDIGRLAGVSGASVSRIKNGYYDYLIDDESHKKDSKEWVKNNVNEDVVKLLGSIDTTLKSILEVLKRD